MSIRTRKLAGVIAVVGFLIAYSLVAMAVGGQFVTGKGKVLEFCYFAFAGVMWLPAVMWIIRWMSHPGKDPSS
jgi:hypothetical protein